MHGRPAGELRDHHWASNAGGDRFVVHLVGGALWRTWTMFVVGAWLALVNGVAVMFGAVTFDLLMATAGGGGFLVAAMYEARRKRS